jgi:hypothetical protein
MADEKATAANVAGGKMADDNSGDDNNNHQKPAGASGITATAADPDDEKKFSQREVDKLIQARLSRGNKSQPKPESQPQSEAAKKPDPLLQLHMAMMDARDAGIQIKPELRKELVDWALLANPENPAEWLEAKLSAMGIQKTAVTAPQKEQPKAQQAMPAQPVKMDRGPAIGAVDDFDNVTGPQDFNADRVSRWQAKFGVDEGNDRIRKAVMESLRGMKVVPDRR